MVPYNYGITGGSSNTWPINSTNTDGTTITFSPSYNVSFNSPVEPVKAELTIKQQAKVEKISVTKAIRKNMNTHTGYRERKEYWR